MSCNEQYNFLENDCFCAGNNTKDYHYQLPYTFIKEPFLQEFQYKVLNRIINCNDKLYIWKIKDNNKC